MKKLALLTLLLISCTNPVGHSEQELEVEYEIENFDVQQDYPQVRLEHLDCKEVYYKDCPMILCRWKEKNHLCLSLESTDLCEEDYFKGYCIPKEIITENL